MRLAFILLALTTLFYPTLGTAQSDRSDPVGLVEGWAYMGYHNGNKWDELYFDSVDGSTIKNGTIVQVRRPVNIRLRPIQLIGNKWRNSSAIRDAAGGERFVVLDVKQPASGYYWLNVREVQGSAPTPQPDPLPDTWDSHENRQAANNVILCYNRYSTDKALITIRTMHDCSGFWVTPKILSRCVLDGLCPALRDTINDRAVLEASLSSLKLTRDSPLQIYAQADFASLPTSGTIEQCRTGSPNSEAFLACVAGKSSTRPLQDCMKKEERERLRCVAELVNNANFNVLVGCSTQGPPSPDAIIDCVPDAAVRTKAAQARSCVTAAASQASALDCVIGQLDPAKKTTAKCATSGLGSTEMAECLIGASGLPASAQAAVKCFAANKDDLITCGLSSADARTKAVVACFDKSAAGRYDCVKQLVSGGTQQAALLKCLDESTKASILTCAAPALGPDVARVSGCLAQKDRAAVPFCVLGDKPEVRAAHQIYRCVTGGSDVSALVESCSEGIVDPKTSQAMSCALRAGGDKAKLAACAAAAVLAPETARIAGCGATSTGATSFALCVVGPAMNEEWRIAAECALSSGGEPMSFAGCTASRLTVRELTKCLTGTIGKDCFGPNNTIIKAYTDAFRDLTQGPGPNNEVVKAVAAIKDLAGGPNSVINNPSQIWGGPNSMVNNPSQIWGGDQSVFNQALGGNNSEVRKILRAVDPTSWW